MATISSVDARARFTKALIDVYQERIRPTDFLTSFFPVVQSGALNVAIEVERMGEKIAVDVVRGTEGNRNTFSRSTEKIWTPPLFAERFEMTELDLYDRVMGSQGNANENLFAALLNQAADRMGTLQDKIDRAKEKMCADVLLTGVLSLTAAEAIDFKRKGTSATRSSIVDLNSGSYGGYFSANSACFDQFKAGCQFLREVGRSPESRFVAIMGETALKDLLANTNFTTRQNLFNMSLDAVTAPRKNAKGASLHGYITAGSYMVELWTYPQIYDAADGTATKYIDDRYVILLPSNPRFKLAHALVPQLVKPGEVPNQATYVYDEKYDEWNTSHEMRVRTAFMPVPVAVDQIYTMKACA